MSDGQALLRATNLTKTYKRPKWIQARGDSAVRALQNVSVSVGLGRTLGIVGRSGAGKSTLARCLACLELPDSGEIWLDQHNLLNLCSSELNTARRQIQLIFQQSAASLNPRFSAIEAVTEPVTVARTVGKKERRELGLAMMESVGLPREAANRRCTEFSGGERQRLAIARALTLSPRVLVLDEVLTGLDLLIQAHMVNLLMELQASQSISYIFISHDFPLTAYLADNIAVMQDGSVVEQGPAERVSQDPQHPHTRTLLASVAQLRFGT